MADRQMHAHATNRIGYTLKSIKIIRTIFGYKIHLFGQIRQSQSDFTCQSRLFFEQLFLLVYVGKMPKDVQQLNRISPKLVFSVQ